jgi:carbon catabolite-derepressing protein kinase
MMGTQWLNLKSKNGMRSWRLWMFVYILIFRIGCCLTHVRLFQPRNSLSPNAISPGGGDLEENPFDAEFNAEYDADDIDDGIDFTPPADVESSHFAVLNSSLPEQGPEQHHLASYMTAKRSSPMVKEKKQYRTKWHFGIRSRSPPMEVMLEIYRTLKTLGMEWKEKKNLGGLGGLTHHRGRSGGVIERARELDGSGNVDMKAASGIYFVETRARVQDVVVCANFSNPLFRGTDFNFFRCS